MEAFIPPRALGHSGVSVPALGVGTNRWGARGRDADRLLPVFSTALDVGMNLFDTAEIYQFGRSERALGTCIRRDPRPVIVVAKFAPYPTRVTARSFTRAFEASLTRLGTESVDVYLIHFPFAVTGVPTLVDRLAEVARDGRVRAVGVSNFGARQMYVAADRLDRRGIALAANEVQFNLAHRAPERDGVLDACRRLGVALIAYRPLAGGRIRRDDTPLGRTVATIARDREKTPAQVALNWLIDRDDRVIAIPGATRPEHVRENAGAVGWTLSEDEIALLERSST